MTEVTRLLRAVAEGDAGASNELLPIVYDSLRQLAHRRMKHETPSMTLQPTALVHESYLRLVQDPQARWDNSRHFYCAAGEAMRRILIERARRVRATKHGGKLERIPFEEAEIALVETDTKLLALDAVITRFESQFPRKAEVVKLRYFVGLTIEETADALGVSPATVKLDWSFARAWIQKEFESITPPPVARHRVFDDSGDLVASEAKRVRAATT